MLWGCDVFLVYIFNFYVGFGELIIIIIVDWLGVLLGCYFFGLTLGKGLSEGVESCCLGSIVVFTFVLGLYFIFIGNCVCGYVYFIEGEIEVDRGEVIWWVVGLGVRFG